MDNQELKLECLKLASGIDGSYYDKLRLAKDFYNWVIEAKPAHKPQSFENCGINSNFINQ